MSGEPAAIILEPGSYPGSHWWKFDFHNHTPASSDYFADEIRTLQPRDWLLAYMRAGVDCVAVTDHNTGEWIDRLKAELAVMESELPSGYRPLAIFPGVEITTSDPLHLLAVFGPEQGKGKIDALMGGKLNVTNPSAPSAERLCSESASSAIDAIHALGGLAIAAHVEMENGLLRGIVNAGGKFEPALVGRSVDDLLAKLDAVEFQRLDCPAFKHFEPRLDRLAKVAGSDSPHRTSNAGQRTTWVKMSAPSLEGLKLALLDAESAVRRSDTCADDPQPWPDSWIESLTLRNLHLRRPGVGELKLKLHPSYNVVIGGRGSGKSTVLEAARLALARAGEIEALGAESEISKTFAAFRGEYNAREKIGMVLPNTEIEAVFVRGKGETQERIRCLWHKVGERFLPEAFRWESGWVNAGLSPDQISSLLPVKLFSQKQILALAQQPQSLLGYIDDSIREHKQAWQKQFNEAKAVLLSARLRLRTLDAELKKKPALELEYKEVSRKAKVFQTANFGPLLKANQRATKQRTALDDFYISLAATINTLQEAVAVAGSLKDADLSPFLAESPAESAAHATALALKADLVARHQQVATLVSAMQQAVTSGQAAIADSEWQRENQVHLDAYSHETARLKAEGINSAQEATKAISSEEQIRKQLEQIKLHEAERLLTEKAVQDAEQTLTACRESLTQFRKDFVEGLFAQNDMLRVTFTSMGNAAGALSGLRQVLRLADNAQFADLWDEDDANARSGLIWDLVDPAIVSTIGERLEQLKSGISDKNKTILRTTLDARLVKRFEGLTPEMLDELAWWFPEDEVTLEYRPRADSKYVSIKAASAGQKTAAMLSFLLLHGDEPLLLDQPEDDLDNALVSELVVEQLRKNKKRRQLVITHNANIVVNADADLVMTMDYLGGQIQCSGAGGLQEREVRENICRVMEGGKEAFQQRYRRILEDLEPRA